MLFFSANDYSRGVVGVKRTVYSIYAVRNVIKIINILSGNSFCLKFITYEEFFSRSFDSFSLSLYRSHLIFTRNVKKLKIYLNVMAHVDTNTIFITSMRLGIYVNLWLMNIRVCVIMIIGNWLKCVEKLRFVFIQIKEKTNLKWIDESQK